MHVTFYPTEINLQVAVPNRLEYPASGLRCSSALGTNLFKIVFKLQHAENSPRGDDKQDPDPAGQVGAEFLLVSTQVCEGVEIRHKPLCEITDFYFSSSQPNVK